jgi:hypothetical protein
MLGHLDHEVETSLDDLRTSLDVARAAIARDPSAATQAQRDQLAANLRMLAGLEQRAAAEVSVSSSCLLRHIGFVPPVVAFAISMRMWLPLVHQPEFAPLAAPGDTEEADMSGYLERSPTQPDVDDEDEFTDGKTRCSSISPP